MASVEAKTPDERRHEDIFNTMWMRVGVSAGERYGSAGDEFLEKQLAMYLDPQRKRYRYVPLPEKTYDLTGYTPTDIDDKRRDLNLKGSKPFFR